MDIHLKEERRVTPETIAALTHELGRRNIECVYCETSDAARELVLSRIPPEATVMDGGSETLKQIGVFSALKSGPYHFLRPKVAAENHPVARVSARRRAAIADIVVGGINAITVAGEIVNVDGSGNRLAAYAYGAGKLILVAGVNKIVPDMNAAFERLRNVAARDECRHLGVGTPCAVTGKCDNTACRGRERQCGKVLIIENEKIVGRISVVLIGESLGY
ncbi:MAG: LUD domain-containing protein [Burkholderiales bacterium]